jgi:plasmid replication initiation protein
VPEAESNPTQIPRTHTEANLARLGLISIQERIPSDFTRWEIEFDNNGRPARLECVAAGDYGGVPHGLDGDIAIALIDLYIEAGASDDGVINTTAYKLLQRSGLSDKGHYYKALRESLLRLRSTLYTASEAWIDRKKERWTSVTFNYIEKFNFVESENRVFVKGTTLVIKLSEVIVRSIHAHHLKPLDLDFLTSLDRPLTRALYRLLDGQRYDPINPESGPPKQELTRLLVEWGRECKIVDPQAVRIRRTLTGAHEELIERGYLERVDFQGRGQKQSITYVFASPHVVSVVDPGVVDALARNGVSRVVGRRLVQEFGEQHVTDRIRKAEALKTVDFTPRNQAGFLIDVIRDQVGKYVEPRSYTPIKVADSDRKKALLQNEQRLIEEFEAAKEAEYRQLSQAGRVDLILKELEFVIKPYLKANQRDRLRAQMMIQLGDPREFRATVLKLIRTSDLIALKTLLDDPQF